MSTALAAPDYEAINDVADSVYVNLAEAKGLSPEEVHKLSLCYEASALLVEGLLKQGYAAQHQILVGPSQEHSVVTVEQAGATSIMVDPTWQQFLPRDARSDHAPKVLVASQPTFAAKAQAYGVKNSSEIWGSGARATSPEEQRAQNSQAERDADQADEDGKWDDFMNAA